MSEPLYESYKMTVQYQPDVNSNIYPYQPQVVPPQISYPEYIPPAPVNSEPLCVDNTQASNNSIPENNNQLLNNVNSVPISMGKSTNNYCFDKIFFSYLILSLIYIPLNIVVNYFYLSESVLGWIVFILIIIGIILFKSIKKYTQTYNSDYSICLSIFLYIFKVGFFFVLCYAEDYTNKESGNESFVYVSEIEQEYLHIPHFLFEACGSAAFYLFLLIYAKIQIQINLCVVFVIGLFVSVVTYLILYFTLNDILAGIVAGLIMIEVGSLIFSIYQSRKNQLLEEEDTTNNIIILDYYKFLLLMLFFLLIILFYLLMLYCLCAILASCKSTPTYYDNYSGRVYDQYHHDMGIHLPKKPKYTSNGKFYDKAGNEIKPSTCQIF